jgi:hypothetical protein
MVDAIAGEHPYKAEGRVWRVGARGTDALVAVTQPPELLLPRGIPAEEAQLAAVGHEVQRVHLRVATAAASASRGAGSNSTAAPPQRHSRYYAHASRPVRCCCNGVGLLSMLPHLPPPTEGR